MANNQTTRFVDVTRTYIPVNPNAFPDSLHEYNRSDIENRIPVMAYKGYNFLPTAYGYKSYFGINQKLGIDDLNERVDFVFVFQNNSLENILIALCDSGIWYKAGDVAGAWTQVHTTPDYRGTQTHYQWTYCIINDDLYVYKQNGASYQKIVSSASSPGFTISSVVPTFLNMTAQMGIFRAGARLGFWDSDDSTAWSSLDDFQDFEPSLETLANATKFSQIVGRIVTILCHGDGFMVYGTKSAVFVQSNPEKLFQWEPTRILDTAGIAYPHQVVAGVPDTVHYMYSNIGLYMIKMAQPEIIVPEVTDFFKESGGPKYVRFMEGRYLAIQMLDAEYLEGIPQFSDEEVPAVTIILPGANANLLDAVEDAKTQGSQGYCPIIGGLGNGGFSQPEDEDPSIVWRPMYTAFLASAGELDPDVDWIADPCNAVDLESAAVYPMTPAGTPTLENATTDDTNKREVSGADAYVDGNWTIERFVAAQSAIWKTQEANLAAKLSEILGRTYTDTRTYENATEVTSVVATECEIGDYVTAYSGYTFGFSQCEFWLTRFALAAAKLKVKKVIHSTSVFVPAVTSAPTPLGWRMGSSFSYLSPECVTPQYASPAEAWNACAMRAFTPPDYGGYIVGDGAFSNFTYGYGGIPLSAEGPNGYTVVREYAACPVGTTGDVGSGCTKAAHWLVTETVNAYIEAEALSITPTPETGFCKLTGWKDIVSGTEIAATECEAPAVVGDKDGDGNVPAGVDDEGNFCSKPFEPFIIPGTPDITVNWPSQSITIPSGSFFLQDGSFAPLYPTFEGAFFYDTHLKKWGKYRGRHMQLIDYAPINSFGPSEQSYSRFGILGGILEEGGSLALFDSFPVDSYITYGKLGYYRQGMTSVEEMRVHMKIPCDFSVTVETSLEGKNLTSGLELTQNFVNATEAIFHGGYPGKWHNIKISGQFDISYLEYRGIINGKR